MLDMKVIRENPELVKENIRKKFQDEKIALVDQVIVLDRENRETKQKADDLRMMRNKLSKEIGTLMKQGAKEEAMAKKGTSTVDGRRACPAGRKGRSVSGRNQKNYDGDSEFDRSICSDRKR